MTQIIACAVVSVLTSLFSEQTLAQGNLKDLCDQLFPQHELERLGYSISYKSEGSNSFAEVEDGESLPRFSLTLGESLKIEIHRLGITLWNPEVNEFKEVTKFDSLTSTLSNLTASPNAPNSVDSKLELPSFHSIQNAEGFLACNGPFQVDSLGNFNLGDKLFLRLQDLFRLDSREDQWNSGGNSGGKVVLFWWLADHPELAPMTLNTESCGLFSLRHFPVAHSYFGLVFTMDSPWRGGPSFAFQGFWPEGEGVGILRSLQDGWVYEGEISDWRFNGEGVWQTREVLGGEGIRVHGLWEEGEISLGSSTYFADSLIFCHMNGEFYCQSEVYSIGIDFADWHISSGFPGERNTSWVFEPLHLKNGVLWTYATEDSGGTVISRGKREIKLISEGSERN